MNWIKAKSRLEGPFFRLLILVLGAWAILGGCDRGTTDVDPPSSRMVSGQKTGTMKFGRFLGQVVYDEAEDSYFLELRGARFPFKASPIEAQHVSLDAPGKTELEKNTALIHGILGTEVLHATLLISPDEEEDVMPAVNDIARSIQFVNPRKFAGLAYTKPGGKLERSVVKGSQIQNFDDATSKTPIVHIRGPKGGANGTGIRVGDGGKVVVEGESYEDLYKTADYIYLTLLKMLCGSPECPDAATCLSGGDCGCGGR